MDEEGSDDGPLVQRIKQLERERDDLQKDIEQLCMQQAGPSYLAVATRMHFQRTAGLEEEIENLRKKLAASVRDNQNLQEELSEAYRIKGQLADLYGAEVSKKVEAEKQFKFFQGCVASAFAERDNSMMEAENAKEREEALSEKLCNYENRLQELQSAYGDEKNNNADLQMELKKLKEQNESFEKVISKFYEIRERATGISECKPLEAKCSSLLDDPLEMWIFDSIGKHTPSSYIDSLEEQLVMLKESKDSLQNQMRVGMEIEQILRKNVHHLEKKLISAGNLFKHCFSTLREFHGQQRSAIMKMLEEENSEIKSILVEVQEKVRLLHLSGELNSCARVREENIGITDCKQEDVASDVYSNIMAKEEDPTTLSSSVHRETNTSDILAQALKEKEEDPTALGSSVHRETNTSDILAQALKEKVEALLLLSQQEERHLLERDVNAALQKKMEDLQRNLVQVTNEKVMALLQLAQLKKEYQLLQVNSRHGMKHVNSPADDGDKSLVAQDRNAKLKNLLKKTYLRRWVGRECESENDIHTEMDLARLKVENAALQESITNIGHLTFSIHKLRLSLRKVMNDSILPASAEKVTMTLNDIFHEVDHVKTALRSSIPVSLSAAPDEASCEQNSDDLAPHVDASGNEKLDPITAVGCEMVELLILAAELVKDKLITGVSSSLS